MKSEFLQVGPSPDFMFCKTFVSDPHGQVVQRTAAEEGREMLMYCQEAVPGTCRGCGHGIARPDCRVLKKKGIKTVLPTSGEHIIKEFGKKQKVRD